MSYVYLRSEPGLWTVGHYSPDGAWHSDSDHGSREEAAERVARLNGSEAMTALRELIYNIDHAEHTSAREKDKALVDARLIAAAPDLLEAARGALGLLTVPTYDLEGIRDALEVAIAKATGA